MSELELMFKKHPLGCTEFGPEWIARWEAVGRLLQKPVAIQVWHEDSRTWTRWVMDNCENNTATALEALEQYARFSPWHFRIILIDSKAVVREWDAS